VIPGSWSGQGGHCDGYDPKLDRGSGGTPSMMLHSVVVSAEVGRGEAQKQ
jgi:hypothetical protein